MKKSSPLVGAPLAPTMIRLAVPGVIGALLFSTPGLIEASFLRAAGTDALAAVALVYPLIILAAMFSAGAIGGAVSGLTARAVGAGDYQEASAVLVCAVVISLFGGVLMWLLVVQFGPLLYQYASQSEPVILIMVPVIFGIGSSLIAIVGAYVGAGQRERAIAIAWRGILFNAVLVGAIGLLLSAFPTVWCGAVGSDATVIDHCSQSLRLIAPTYAFFALGLGGYFASQGLNTLKFPVIGALLRLLIVMTGLYWVTATTSVTVVLLMVASAVVVYGLFVILALKYKAWR